MQHFTSSRGLHVDHGGAGEPTLILLHGMGANAAAWERMLPFVQKEWPGRWFAPDLRGHGRSLREGPYGHAMHAADIAALMEELGARNAAILGHSYGGLIAAALGSGWYGPRPARVVAVSVKLVWTQEEVDRSHAIAEKPQRGFATQAEAIERGLKVAGLFGQADLDSAVAIAGVREIDGQHHAAFDARALAGVNADIEAVFHTCKAPMRIAAGDRDEMASFEAMRRVDPDACVFADTGHNAPWERPEVVWRFFLEG